VDHLRQRTRARSSERRDSFEGVIVTDAIGAVAASWGVLMAISPILQIRRVLDRRSSADISVSYLAVLQVGFTLWIAYGIALRNAAIIVPNSVAFLVGVATILIAVRFRAGREARVTLGDGDA
jgi:MtN3 and saliva related transmembrane protein